MLFKIEDTDELARSIRRLYGNGFGLSEDHLARAILHHMEPIIAASNRTCRKNAAYNGIVNKELGRPAAGTVGLNSTTCLLSAIGLHCWYHQRRSLRRCGDVAGCQGAGARRSPYAAERRRGGQGGFRGIVEERGMRVTLTETARHAAGRVVYLYLPY